MARVSFSVEGLMRRGADSGATAADLVRALREQGFAQARFDPCLELFSVEIDPAVQSFSDLRRAVSDLGRRKGLTYLAVVMSP
jgi:hypothetical protein